MIGEVLKSGVENHLTETCIILDHSLGWSRWSVVTDVEIIGLRYGRRKIKKAFNDILLRLIWYITM